MSHYEPKEQDLPQEQSKLRLDFFLGLGLELVVGDEVKKYDFKTPTAIDGELEDWNRTTECDKEWVINSLTPRKNTGEKPCGDDVPIVASWHGGDNTKNKVDYFTWGFKSGFANIKSWKPDLEALLKMQDEHDNKTKIKVDEIIQARNKSHDSKEDQASKNLLNAVYAQSIEQDENGNVEITEPSPFVGFSKSLNELKNIIKTVNQRMIDMDNQQKYTVECAKLINGPSENMLCRIEYNCTFGGIIKVVDFTFKFETENEYCGLDKDGHCLAIDKEEFVAFHAVDERSEMDIAKEQQRHSVYHKLRRAGHRVDSTTVEFMQEKGMLAEIILLLEK